MIDSAGESLGLHGDGAEAFAFMTKKDGQLSLRRCLGTVTDRMVLPCGKTASKLMVIVCKAAGLKSPAGFLHCKTPSYATEVIFQLTFVKLPPYRL